MRREALNRTSLREMFEKEDKELSIAKDIQKIEEILRCYGAHERLYRRMKEKREREERR